MDVLVECKGLKKSYGKIWFAAGGGYLYTRKTPPQEPRDSIYIGIKNFPNFLVLCLA